LEIRFDLCPSHSSFFDSTPQRRPRSTNIEKTNSTRKRRSGVGRPRQTTTPSTAGDAPDYYRTTVARPSRRDFRTHATSNKIEPCCRAENFAHPTPRPVSRSLRKTDMPRPECQQLDAQLNGDLTEREAAQFTAHLAVCAPCRTTVAQQVWIDSLLRDSATTEAVPARVSLGIDRAITRTQKRRRLAGGFAAMTAAATLFIAFGIDSIHQPEPSDVSSPTTNHQPPLSPPLSAAKT